MGRFFVPYSSGRPVAVDIKGHRLVILTREKYTLEQCLPSLGADSLRAVKSGNSEQEEHFLLSHLAQAANAGVVIAPKNIELPDVIRNLESQLPWLQ